MHPQGELILLARRKTALRRSIVRQRAECVEAAAAASQPLVWLDTAHRIWRSIAPLAKLVAWPLGGAVVRSFFPGQKILRALLRWAPAAFTVFSTVRRMRGSHSRRRDGS
jgi:hypothetical protein